MKHFHLHLALLGAFIVAATNNAHAQQPTPLLTQPADKLIAVLQSDATQKEKVDACRQLAVIGTKEAVPTLAALLADEKLSHMARYALETIPDSSADEALRAALTTLHGRPLVGVVGSIGVRRDAQAVPSLANLLANGDSDVAQAAARALGTIANPAAVTALEEALPKAPAQNQLALCEGLLKEAEKLAKNDPKQAGAIYEQLRKLQGPKQVRVAAIRGAILARGSSGINLLREELQSKDYLNFAAAIRTSYELPGAEVTKALSSELPHLADNDRKILVVQALGKRTNSPALSALSAAAKNEAKPVQIAALQALAETGNASAAPMLADSLGANDRDIAQAALDGLAGLKGKEVDSTIQLMLRGSDGARRLAAIELIGRRRMTACLPDLLTMATGGDSKSRPAALSKMGDLGSAPQITSILDLLPKLTATADLEAAEQALNTLCAKAEKPEANTEKVAARLSQAQPAQKGVLLRVLSSIGGVEALQAVRGALVNSNPDVHAAALRALGAWKTADAAPDLLVLAKSASNSTDQTLALRSYLGLAANADVPASQRLSLCRDGAGVVKSNEEKQLLLAALGGIESPESVALITPYLDNAGTKEEASAALTAIADKMLKSQKNSQVASKLVQPLEKVVQTTTNEELAKRAKALLAQAQKAAQTR